VTDFYFFAPTGEELQGTSESVPGTSPCSFTNEERDYDHDGGTKFFYDGAETLSIEGVTLFTCESGDDWLAHHLIPGDGFEGDEAPDGLSDKTIALIKTELNIGYALEAAKRLRENYASCTLGIVNPGAAIELHLRKRYRAAKEAACTAIAVERGEQARLALGDA
jgi:hypothetical protein